MKIAVAYNDDLHLKPHLNETEKLGDGRTCKGLDSLKQDAAAS